MYKDGDITSLKQNYNRYTSEQLWRMREYLESILPDLPGTAYEATFGLIAGRSVPETGPLFGDEWLDQNVASFQSSDAASVKASAGCVPSRNMGRSAGPR